MSDTKIARDPNERVAVPVGLYELLVRSLVSRFARKENEKLVKFFMKIPSSKENPLATKSVLDAFVGWAQEAGNEPLAAMLPYYMSGGTGPHSDRRLNECIQLDKELVDHLVAIALQSRNRPLAALIAQTFRANPGPHGGLSFAEVMRYATGG